MRALFFLLAVVLSFACAGAPIVTTAPQSPSRAPPVMTRAPLLLPDYVPIVGVDVPIPDESQPPPLLPPDSLQVRLTACRDVERRESAFSVQIRNVSASTVYLFPEPRSGHIIGSVGWWSENAHQGGVSTSTHTCSEGPCPIGDTVQLAPGSELNETASLDPGVGRWEMFVSLAASPVSDWGTPQVTQWPSTLNVTRAKPRAVCARREP